MNMTPGEAFVDPTDRENRSSVSVLNVLSTGQGYEPHSRHQHDSCLTDCSACTYGIAVLIRSILSELPF